MATLLGWFSGDGCGRRSIVMMRCHEDTRRGYPAIASASMKDDEAR
jgi:hypothetical protein